MRAFSKAEAESVSGRRGGRVSGRTDGTTSKTPISKGCRIGTLLLGSLSSCKHIIDSDIIDSDFQNCVDYNPQRSTLHYCSVRDLRSVAPQCVCIGWQSDRRDEQGLGSDVVPQAEIRDN